MEDRDLIRAEFESVGELEFSLDPTPEMNVHMLSEAEAIQLEIEPCAYMGKPGMSPRIGADDCWEVYDNGTGTWLPTGISARGVSDYDELTNRPKINGNLLTGDKTGRQLGLEERVTNADIDQIFVL